MGDCARRELPRIAFWCCYVWVNDKRRRRLQCMRDLLEKGFMSACVERGDRVEIGT